MELKKTIFDNQPELVETEGNSLRINFDVATSTLTPQQDGISMDGKAKQAKGDSRIVFEAYVVRIAQPIERDKMVNAIITAAYPADKMQAIINNHLVNLATQADGQALDADEQQHEQEYQEMQQWRTHAKEVAQKALDYYLDR